MDWTDILKVRRKDPKKDSLRAVKDDKKTKPTRLEVGLPVPRKMKTAPSFGRTRVRRRTKSSEKPKEKPKEENVADASDVLPPLEDLRADWTKKPRGLYADLSDEVTKLASIARKNPRLQKEYLGKIRRLINEANIPERD
tara:strand:+ start:2597 stop:3016 length:420 start_codon:yes stop_codon:yes gene_type:complete